MLISQFQLHSLQLSFLVYTFFPPVPVATPASVPLLLTLETALDQPLLVHWTHFAWIPMVSCPALRLRPQLRLTS